MEKNQKNRKKYSLKSLLGISILSLTIGFGIGIAYKNTSSETPNKISPSRLEELIKEEKKPSVYIPSYYKEEYAQFLKSPNAVELVKELGDKFEAYYVEKYAQFLKSPNAIELVKELGDKFKAYYVEKYAQFLKSPNAIELVKELGDKFEACYVEKYAQFLKSPNAIELVKELGDEFKHYSLKEYAFLLNQNFSPKTIAEIPSFKVDDITKLLKQSRIPKELIPYFTDSIKNYSIEVAGKNPVFGTEENKIRNYIKKKLSQKQHSFRKYTDYEEDLSQVDSIDNINILYLIKGYIDYFDKPENVKIIFDMMGKDLTNFYSEEGGLVVYSNRDYKFIRYNSRDFEIKNLENNSSYNVPDWFKYIGHIGLFHFHATKDDDIEYSGPSGSVKSKLEFFNGDLGVLRSYIKDNPYEIHCVITKLKGDRFNVDLYFHDIWEFMFKDSESEATVLDLGIYDKHFNFKK